MKSLEEAVSELAEDFSSLGDNDKLELLLEYSDRLPELPQKYSDHPDLLERVEECQAPVYLFVDEHEDGSVQVVLTAPREAPTTRGFAAILYELFDKRQANEILSIDSEFPERFGLTALISPLRMRGVRGMISRIKRSLNDKSN